MQEVQQKGDLPEDPAGRNLCVIGDSRHTNCCDPRRCGQGGGKYLAAVRIGLGLCLCCRIHRRLGISSQLPRPPDLLFPFFLLRGAAHPQGLGAALPSGHAPRLPGKRKKGTRRNEAPNIESVSGGERRYQQYGSHELRHGRVGCSAEFSPGFAVLCRDLFSVSGLDVCFFHHENPGTMHLKDHERF